MLRPTRELGNDDLLYLLHSLISGTHATFRHATSKVTVENTSFPRLKYVIPEVSGQQQSHKGCHPEFVMLNLFQYQDLVQCALVD